MPVLAVSFAAFMQRRGRGQSRNWPLSAALFQSPTVATAGLEKEPRFLWPRASLRRLNCPRSCEPWIFPTRGAYKATVVVPALGRFYCNKAVGVCREPDPNSEGLEVYWPEDVSQVYGIFVK